MDPNTDASRHFKDRSTEGGFTLLEAIIAAAVSALLISFITSSLLMLERKQRVSSLAGDDETTRRLARQTLRNLASAAISGPIWLNDSLLATLGVEGAPNVTGYPAGSVLIKRDTMLSGFSVAPAPGYDLVSLFVSDKSAEPLQLESCADGSVADCWTNRGSIPASPTELKVIGSTSSYLPGDFVAIATDMGTQIVRINAVSGQVLSVGFGGVMGDYAMGVSSTRADLPDRNLKAGASVYRILMVTIGVSESAGKKTLKMITREATSARSLRVLAEYAIKPQAIRFLASQGSLPALPLPEGIFRPGTQGNILQVTLERHGLADRFDTSTNEYARTGRSELRMPL